MFVSMQMSSDPVTITSETTVNDALQLMQTNKFRRLPVVDNGKLVGIVTDRDLRAVLPSTATTLSIHELNYLLDKLQIKDVMTKQVITIMQDATIEEAALIMAVNRIGGLVVTNSSGNVCGLITETDIFKCFVDSMGLEQQKTRLTIDVTDKVGVLSKITGIFAELNIYIDSLATYPLADGRKELVIRADVSESDSTVLFERLAAIECQVIHVVHIGGIK